MRRKPVAASGESTVGENEKDQRLAGLLKSYLDRCARGEDVSLDGLDPELRDELETLIEIDSILDDKDFVGQFGEDFRIIDEAGRGGMGIVYEAWQISLDRRVALKILPANLLADETAVQRFRREAKVAAALTHPNIVGVYSMGIESGTPYFTMEYARGETLQKLQRRIRSSYTGEHGETEAQGLHSFTDRLSQDRHFLDRQRELEELGDLDTLASGHAITAPRTSKIDTEYCLRIAEAFAGAADGLHYAHVHGVYHRDLKPSNLILDSSGRLRVLDFGLARVEGELSLTLSRERVGTPLYMSPEQARSDTRIGAGTDIYSLGATLYEMLAGRPPFLGKNYEDVLQQIALRDPLPLRRLRPSISKDLETIVMQCLRKRVEDRYATAEALAQDLRRFVRGEPIEARPQPLLEKIVRRIWRSPRRAVESAAVLSLVIVVVLAVFGHLKERSRLRDLRYADSVNHAVMKIVERALVPLAAGRGAVFPEELVAEVDSSGRFTQWRHRLFKGGARAVDSGTSFAAVGVDPSIEAEEVLRRAIETCPERAVAYYHLARCLVLRGLPDEARAPLERALKLDPTFVPACSLCVVLFEAVGDPRAARARNNLERAIEASGNAWEVAWIQANRALLVHDWEDAATAYERLLEKAAARGEDEFYVGFFVETLLGRGVARLKAGKSDEALEDFGAAFRKWPDWISPGVLLGKAYYLDKKKRRAEDVFRSTVERAKALGEMREGEAVEAIVSAYAELGDPSAAVTWADEIRSTRERAIAKAELLALLGHAEEARQLVSDLDAEPSNDAKLSFALGNVLWLDGEFAEARRHLDVAHRLDPTNPGPLVQIGLCLEAEGELEEALTFLERAERTDPTFVLASYNAARVLSQLGDDDQALRRYERVLEIDPGNAFALNNCGALFDLRGDLDRAIESYRGAVRSDPGFALAHYNLGWALLRRFEYREAESEFRKALECGLTDGIVYAHIGSCLYNQGRFLEAAAAYQKATETRPDYAAAHHHRGAALDMCGATGHAIDSYTRAVELAPEWAEAHFDLGFAYDREKQLENARSAYERAVELDPSFVKAQDRLADVLLRSYEPLPEGDELRENILRWERARRLNDVEPTIDCLLHAYRQKLRPRFASFESVNAVLEEQQVVLGEESAWRYFVGLVEPPANWFESGFDDSTWSRAVLPIASAELPVARTIEEDMLLRSSTLYLRGRFTLDQERASRPLLLKVRADDAFVAYINGHEVGRQRCGKPGSSPPRDATAEANNWNPLVPEWVLIEPDVLQAGENVVSIQGIKFSSREPWFFLAAALESGDPGPDELAGRAQRMLDNLRVAANTPRDREILTYLEGRQLQLAGRPVEAAARFREIEATGTYEFEPILGLAQCLRAAGDPLASESVLRSALESGLSEGRSELWDEWMSVVLVDLKQDVERALETFPASGLSDDADERAEDLLWLLRTLPSGLRIDCGGKLEIDVATGEPWSRDRFFLAGRPGELHKIRGKQVAAESSVVYWTERYFMEPRVIIPGYAIPLPPGAYRVTLHLLEGYFEKEGKRRFDVLLEGRDEVREHEPLRVGFGVPESLTYTVVVDDGLLNIDFRRRVENPNIAALEIVEAPEDR